MKYNATAVEGAFIVSLEPRGDERGFFSRVFCAEEFSRLGLEGSIAQINTSVSANAGTLRGMHYQVAPYGEAKLVKCIRGAAFDVVVDLRKDSPTFGRWAGETLTMDNRMMMYVPKGCAHGFLTLEDDTEMLYSASAPYQGAAERVLRWNDPRFAVVWPRSPEVLSPKDQDAGDYESVLHDPGY
jgi:dTDP-4-dehydrorhamnose 3,5-epimerase